MKLERKAYMLYVDSTFKRVVSSAKWVLVGDDIEELSTELNPDMETTKNILGQTKTKDNGYEPTTDADPFYADTDNKLYKPLLDIALDRKKGAACQTLTLEVVVEDTDAENHLAYVQEVIAKPQSYGGDTGGFNIPFQISEDGKRTKGYVSKTSLNSGTPEFTEGEIPGPTMSKTDEKETGKSLS